MNMPSGFLDAEAGPRQFGRYQVIGQQRKPVIGVVYKAFDPQEHRMVAIKAVRREMLEDSESDDKFPKRIWNEIQAIGKLRHPGIISLYDSGQTSEYAYFATEFVDDPALAELLDADTQFDVSEAVVFIASLLDALEHAHQSGIWHRDLSPRCVVVSATGQAKITDFFLARVDSSALTSVGEVLGTRGYVAPETYRGQALDHRTDIFGAGALLYRLLTGVAPFTGTPQQVFQQVLEMNVRPPSQHRPHLARMDGIVLRAMAAKPADRYESAAEFRNALLAVAPQPGLVPTPGAQLVSAAELAHRAAPTPGPAAPAPAPAATPSPSARLLDDGDDFDAALVTAPKVRVALAPGLPGRAPMGPSVAPNAAPTAATAVSPQAPAGLPPELISLAQERLTVQLGPIASVLVRRAAAGASSRGDFLARLLAQIPDEAGRRKFSLAMASVDPSSG